MKSILILRVSISSQHLKPFIPLCLSFPYINNNYNCAIISLSKLELLSLELFSLQLNLAHIAIFRCIISVIIDEKAQKCTLHVS